ncbi:hypothetical protein H2203_004295 [Taxawa tesnikishii (nom. ined.)]|nr:hypothetical protein H2203_004295 [Dothideales sp. JES 119]
MAGFLSNLVNEFTHQGGSSSGGGGYGGQGGGYGGGDERYSQPVFGGGSSQGPPPQVSPPWRAVWDERERRWLFINEANGERTFEYPGGGGYGQQGGYGGGYGRQGGYGEGYGQQGGYGGGYEEPRQEKKHHNYGEWQWVPQQDWQAGEEVKQDWDEDKYRMENKFDNGVEDVEYAPERMAGWAGRKVGEVEDIPQDIENDYDRAKWGVENRFDNAVQDVEDIPDDIANRVGEGVGDVERWGDDVDRYGDRLDNAYDAGRNEGRDDGW